MKVSKQMKKQIGEKKEYFLSRTSASHIVNYLNGFVAVGVFRTPQKHLTNKKVNALWVYQVGFDRKGSKIIDIQNAEIALDEGEDLMRCLGIALKRAKTSVGGETMARKKKEKAPDKTK